MEPRAVVLVEGLSDQRAVLALAVRRGRDLTAERVCVVSMGGATSISSYLERYGPHGAGVKLAGLCDLREETYVRRSLERAGLAAPGRVEMEALGFHVCEVDLEDELIRALGADAVEEIIDAEGELTSFRTLQKQPAQRDRSVHDQLRRFMGTTRGRKIRYASLLVDALDLGRVPRPLDSVLAHVSPAPLRTDEDGPPGDGGFG